MHTKVGCIRLTGPGMGKFRPRLLKCSLLRVTKG